MFQSDVLSTTTVEGLYIGARSNYVSAFVDYEDGGIAIDDTSEGLLYQTWQININQNKDIYYIPTTGLSSTVYSGTHITEVSGTFDQNMRPAFSFVDLLNPYLRWYDSSLGAYTVTPLDPNIIYPKVFLDDKREWQAYNSDIILGYIRSGNLYFRMQRDRFTIEYLLKENISTLFKIGMNSQLRVQFMVG